MTLRLHEISLSMVVGTVRNSIPGGNSGVSEARLWRFREIRGASVQ